MIENNSKNRRDLAITQYNNMDLDALEMFVVEHLEQLYERCDPAFQDDWQAYMIPE